MRRLFVAGLIATVGIATAVALALAGSPSQPQWTEMRPSLLERTEVAAARIDRYVYVVGGFEKESGRTISAVLRYDLERDSWGRVRSLPAHVNHTAATVWDGKLYVYGGYTAPRDLTRPTRALFRYDPLRDRWKRLRGGPAPRAAHTMQAIAGRLYVVGGVVDGAATNGMDV